MVPTPGRLTAPLLLSLLIPGLAAGGIAQAPSDTAWREVSGILQAPSANAGGYIRFNVPRKDLTVRIGDIPIPAGFALTSWVGFDGSPGSATAMGDLVVTATELGPVLAELERQDVEVTAIHNHLVGETPQVTYVHFHVTGPAARTARALDAALRLTGAPRPVPAPGTAPVTIDSARVFAGLGKTGKASGAMAQVSFILVQGQVLLHGQPVLPALGYASPINILQLSPTRAVATGDFAVTGDRLTPLLRALAASGVTATATHNHLVGEEPKIYFVHFWADAPLDDLVRGLRAAVDAARAE
jgi:uncharacterized protein DUF1259